MILLRVWTAGGVCSSDAGLVLKLAEALLIVLKLCSMVLDLNASTTYKTLNFVETSGVMLEARVQTSRNCLDALVHVLNFSGIVVNATLACFKLVVVLLILSLQLIHFTAEFFDDLVALFLLFFEGGALGHQLSDLIGQAQEFDLHSQLILLQLFATCAFKQLILSKLATISNRINGEHLHRSSCVVET